MKVLKILIVIFFAGIMIYASADLPLRAGSDNLMNAETSPTGSEVIGSYFIQNAYKDAKTPNIVTVVLGDYRSIDTFGEQIVIYTAGIITILLLRVTRRRRNEKPV